MIALLAACATEDPFLPRAETGATERCGPTGVERDGPRCDQGALELLAFTTGCADALALDLWEEDGRHERHPLQLVTVPDPDAATWSLGAVLAGVAPADWSPGSASAVRCDALDDVTFALAVEVGGLPARCSAWGPQAAEIQSLPGSVCD